MRARLIAAAAIGGALLSSCLGTGEVRNSSDGGSNHADAPLGAADARPGEADARPGAADAPRGPDGGQTGPACVPDVDTFEKDVWIRVLATRCATCHSSGGVAAGSRMVFVAATAEGGMQVNLDAAKAMALATEEGQPLLLRRSLGTNHVGGLVVTSDSAEYQALADFTGKVRGDVGACTATACKAGDPAVRLLRRLTPTEFENTVNDLFGVTGYASGLVADPSVHGFDNNAAALLVSTLLADQYRKAAEDIGTKVAAQSAYACSGDGPTCAKTFLNGKAARIFRRPLTSTEVTRWLAVYTVGSQNPATGQAAHQAGMELLIAGLLQSPAFLYRSELGVADGSGGYNLTSYEIASELSYLFWASSPDDTLWNAAAADSLKDPAAIATQAKRLLASPRARASLDHFTTQWLTVGPLPFIAKDATVYPEITPAIRSAMAEELSHMVTTVALGGGTLADLFTTKKTYVNAALASFYGIAAPTSTDSSGFGEVTARNGLLGTGAVLTAHGRPNGSSPIARGKLVREQILCGILPTPPSGVVAQPPDADPNQTTRQRYAAHSSDPACMSCHRLVDGLGWGFEHFDGIGRYRATENSLPIDDSGSILATISTDGTYTGLDELSSHLGSSSEVASCFALHWARYAYALKENAKTACLTDGLRSQFVDNGGKISDLLIALTQASQFTKRGPDNTQSGGDTTPDAGPGTPDAGTGTPDARPGTPDAGTSTPDAAPTDPGVTTEVTVELKRTSTWNTGFCDTVIISNPSDHAVTWRVAIDFDGTIYNKYNINIVSQSGTHYVITGVDFNATVAPGKTAEGGFCANL